MKCPYCGKEHVEGARFCTVTGKPLLPEPEPVIEFQQKKQIPRWLVTVLIVAVLACIVVIIGGLFAYRGTQGEGPLAMLATDTQTPRPTRTERPTKTATLPPTMTASATAIPTATFTPTSSLSIGSTMIREKDGMEMVYVPAGTFIMGSNGISVRERPVHEVFLNDYWIDKYEVTNAQYEICVADGVCEEPSSFTSYTRDNYYGNPDYANYPVIWINWFKAEAYCEWVGGRLPTEAQWEKAARGTDGRTYPWGESSPNCDLVNYGGINGCVGDTSAVGSYPEGASPYGALDMAGNTWEWVKDRYQSDYYDTSPDENPVGPAAGDHRVLRGGSWYVSSPTLRVAYRAELTPNGVSNPSGFRCAYPVSGQ